MSAQNNLIDSLVTDLTPARPSVNPNLQALLWLAVSAAWVVFITSVIGPLRVNAFAQLQAEPRFLFEMLLGLAAILALSVCLFQAAVPGFLNRKRVWVAAGLFFAWVLSYMFGLVSPALEPSMLGKRPHCYLETFLVAILPLLLAIFCLRNLFPLNPHRSAMAAGLAAGMLPALYMQIACMYDPAHILAFHIAPGAAVALCGLALVRFVRVGGGLRCDH